jgi:hypothetical protein
VPVIVLRALAGGGVHRPLQAARTMPPIGGVRFVSVQHRRDQAVGRRRQSLAPFEPRMHLPLHSAQAGHFDLAGDPPQRIARRQIGPQPTAPEVAGPRLPQGIEAAQSGQEHDRQGPHDHPRSDLGLAAGIAYGVEARFPAQARPCVGQESSENGLNPAAGEPSRNTDD